jgi:hypothetical protein
MVAQDGGVHNARRCLHVSRWSNAHDGGTKPALESEGSSIQDGAALPASSLPVRVFSPPENVRMMRHEGCVMEDEQKGAQRVGWWGWAMGWCMSRRASCRLLVW